MKSWEKVDTENYIIYGSGIEGIDINDFKNIDGILKLEKTNGLRVSYSVKTDALNNLLGKLMKLSVKITEIIKEEENLEKVFLKMTGKSLGS